MTKPYYDNNKIKVYNEYGVRFNLEKECIANIQNLLNEIENISNDKNAKELTNLFNKYSIYNYNMYYETQYYVELQRKCSNGNKYYIVIYKNNN